MIRHGLTRLQPQLPGGPGACLKKKTKCPRKTDPGSPGGESPRHRDWELSFASSSPTAASSGSPASTSPQAAEGSPTPHPHSLPPTAPSPP